MENKKIKNASEITAFGIKFKSHLEKNLYSVLIEEGLHPLYEEGTYILSDQIRTTVPFYNNTKKQGFHLDTKPLPKITYTPDFVFTLNGVIAIIEVKGFENDTFSLKRNLFRKCIEDAHPHNLMYFEVKNKHDLLEALKIIKSQTPTMFEVRRRINCLPSEYISRALKLLENKKYEDLIKLVQSVIDKLEKDVLKSEEQQKYSNVELHLVSELFDYIKSL